MTRLLVGGTPEAVGVAAGPETRSALGSNLAVRAMYSVPRMRYRLFASKTGGTPIVDLLTANGQALPGGVVTADDFGLIPAVQLPNDLVVNEVWADPVDDVSEARFCLPVRYGPADVAPVRGPVSTITREDLAASSLVRPAGSALLDQWGFLYGPDGFSTDRQLKPTPDALVVPPGGGRTGVSNDVPMLADMAAQAAEIGAALRFQAGASYNVRGRWTVPPGVSLRGAGRLQTIFYCNANGYVQFGNLDSSGPGAGVGAGEWPLVADLTIHGTNNAVSPMRVGYGVNTVFERVLVTRAKAGGPALIVRAAQNCVWYFLRVVGNGDNGVLWDWGPANHSLFAPIIRDNAGWGEVFTRSSRPPDNTSVIEYPRNIKHFGGLIENNALGNILGECGQQIEFSKVQTSGDAGGPPNVVLSDRLAAIPTAPMGGWVWSGGQLKAGDGDGVALRVLRSEVYLSDNVNLRGAEWGIEIGPNGLVDLGKHRPENTTHLARAIAGVNPDGSAITAGAPPLRRLLKRTAEAPFIDGPTAAVDLPVNSTALVDVAGLAVALAAEAEYDLEIRVVAKDSSNGAADMREALSVPAGATARWSSDALQPGATAAQSAVWRESLDQTSTKTGVGLISGDTVHTITGRVTTGATAGTLQYRAAQQTSGSGVVTISPDSLIRITRTL